MRRGLICHTPPEGASDELSREVLALLGLLGRTVELEERLLDPATAVMGCSPAYFALIAEVLADAGAREGLDEELSRELVLEALAGTARAAGDPPPRLPSRRRRLAGRQHRGRSGGTRSGRRDEGVRARGAGVDGADASMIGAAIGRNDVADYVEALFFVYLVLIFIRVLMSWIPRMPYNRYLRAAVGFVEEVTDPYLNVFRRFVPPLGGGGFALDLSPILAIILLLIAQNLVVGLIRG